MAEALPTGDGLLIRSALLSDVTPLLALVNGYASQGIMLPRTELELAENIRDFTIAAAGGALVGCGALHFYGTRTAEVRSLAVHPDWKQHGVGKRLMGAIEADAVAHGIQVAVRLHLRPDFLPEAGFRGSRPASAPLEGLERLPALPQIAVLRRDRYAKAAHSGGCGDPSDFRSCFRGSLQRLDCPADLRRPGRSL